MSTELQNLEGSTEQILVDQPSVEKAVFDDLIGDHSINLWSPVHSPVSIVSQEHILDQSYVEQKTKSLVQVVVFSQ